MRFIALLALATTLTAADFYSWKELPELPDPIGVAGPVVGISNGALIVAGGANFHTPPYEGGQKLWHDKAWALDSPDGQWRHAGMLTHPLGYSANVSTSEGVIVLGGSDRGDHFADVVRLNWNGRFVTEEPLPSLPRRCANTSATILDGVIYIAGGQEAPDSDRALHTFWALDLNASPLEWLELEPWPGPARILPVVVAQDGGIHVISGAELYRGGDGAVTRRFLTDGYRYRPGEGWKRIADVPRPAVAAPAIAEGQTHIMVFGGDDGANFLLQAELRANHPGFRRNILAYHTVTDTWTESSLIPFSQVTTTAIRWHGQVIIPSGEDRPGHRTPKIWGGTLADSRSQFATLDYVAMGLYLTSLVAMGLYVSRKNKGTEDFFLAGRRIPWWAAGLSIFGTQLSSISFLAAPAKVYATNWVYFGANVAIVAITPLVVYCYLPFFRQLNVTSAYEYLERRFNLPVRLFGSTAFILYQLGRMAIVLFLPALALSTVTGLNVYACILVMGILCTFYTVIGGIEAVIWTDVLQVGILLGGAFVSLVLIIVNCGGLGEVLTIGMADNKFHMIDWNWDITSTAVWIVLLGNIFGNLGPYTSDQVVVQRYLTTKDENAAAKSIWTNALMVLPGTFIWFGLGTALYVFYKLNPQHLDPATNTDAIFPLFIAQQLPAGLSGLIIAAVFAATMSTLDSSMNSVSTAVVTDFYKRFRPQVTDAVCLRLAKWLTALLGATATSAAVLLATYNIASLWDIFQQVMGLFGGALAGLFALGIFTRRATGPGALIGAAASVVVLYWVKTYTPVHFFLYAVVGVSTCMLGGYATSLFLPGKGKDLAGLTVYTKGQVSN
jgi:solute:Na+ symporter, SSS family